MSNILEIKIDCSMDTKPWGRIYVCTEECLPVGHVIYTGDVVKIEGKLATIAKCDPIKFLHIDERTGKGAIGYAFTIDPPEVEPCE